jgi:hypothetical protein
MVKDRVLMKQSQLPSQLPCCARALPKFQIQFRVYLGLLDQAQVAQLTYWRKIFTSPFLYPTCDNPRIPIITSTSNLTHFDFSPCILRQPACSSRRASRSNFSVFLSLCFQVPSCCPRSRKPYEPWFRPYMPDLIKTWRNTSMLLSGKA